MEITENMVYWITRLDSIRWIPVLVALPVLVKGCVLWFSGETPRTNLVRAMIYWFVFMLFAISVMFIPTTKQMCAIKIIPIIAKNEDMKEIPGEITKLAREWIEELSPKESNEK